MGYWELKIEKKLENGKTTHDIYDLTNDEIGKIMEQIRQRYSDGDIDD